MVKHIKKDQSFSEFTSKICEFNFFRICHISPRVFEGQGTPFRIEDNEKYKFLSEMDIARRQAIYNTI